jgi:hypothetical protein
MRLGSDMGRTVVEIGGLRFPTKKAAEEFFKAMLYRYETGSPIPEPDATHLGWLLERHPEHRVKIGNGIDRFVVLNTLWGARGFAVLRCDGSAETFSYMTALDGKSPPVAYEVMQALRFEVQDQILSAKSRYFLAHQDAADTVACAITGRRVTFRESHADHAPPRTFSTLASTFLAAHDLTPSLDLLAPPVNHKRRLADRTLAERWRAFHHKLAAIRVVAKGENVKRSAQAKVRAADKQLILS